MLETLLSFIIATTVLAISPGPDNIFVLVQSVSNGKKYGLATVFGLISGCLVHTTLLAFGVSAVIKDSEHIYFLIKLFGAIYLLYLAVKVFKSDSAIIITEHKATKRTEIQLFKQGFIMNVLNPKVTIFFLAFFPGFLFSDQLSTITQFYILGLLFMVTSLLIFSSIAILAGSIAAILHKNRNIGYFLKWLQILVFIGIAIFILFS